MTPSGATPSPQDAPPSGPRAAIPITAPIMALLLIATLVVLWVHVLDRHAQRREAALESWLKLEQEIVGGAARATEAWLTELIEDDGLSAEQAQQEVLSLFIEPIQLLKDGDAWIYADGHPVFDESEDFPDEYFGKNLAQIFEIQAEHGAYHYNELVEGVQGGGSGTTWYVWLPDKGREFAAYTTVQVHDGSWTIGLSTPEPQILSFFQVPETFLRELIGTAIISVLLVGLAVALWLKQRSDARRLTGLRLSHADLERAVAERTERLEAINRDLTRSNEDLEQFAYAASHDLQAPLRTISSFLGLLRSRYGDRLGPDATEFIDYSVSGAQRLSDQINGLLQYSRVTTAGQTLTPVRLGPLVQGALENLRGAIEETGARVVLPQDPPTVMADAGQVTMLFQNLIGNAIKYRHPHRVPEVTLTVRRQDGRCRVDVADNGIGIAPEYQGRVFGVFQRLHGPGEFEGTGIGLALCKRIVDRHGGDLTVRSDGACGSVFSFTLALPPNPDARHAAGADD